MGKNTKMKKNARLKNDRQKKNRMTELPLQVVVDSEMFYDEMFPHLKGMERQNCVSQRDFLVEEYTDGEVMVQVAITRKRGSNLAGIVITTIPVSGITVEADIEKSFFFNLLQQVGFPLSLPSEKQRDEVAELTNSNLISYMLTHPATQFSEAAHLYYAHVSDLSVQEYEIAPSTPYESVIAFLASSHEWKVRLELSRNPFCSPAVLSQLGSDPQRFVRAWTAKNPNTPVDVLQKLIAEEVDMSGFEWSETDSGTLVLDLFPVVADEELVPAYQSLQNPQMSGVVAEATAALADTGITKQNRFDSVENMDALLGKVRELLSL